MGAQRTLKNARAEAVRLDDAIGSEHVVLGLLRGDSVVPALFARLGLNLASVEQPLEASGGRRPARASTEQLDYTSHTKRLIEAASKTACDSGSALPGEHLLLGSLQEPRGALVKILVSRAPPPFELRRKSPGRCCGLQK